MFNHKSKKGGLLLLTIIFSIPFSSMVVNAQSQLTTITAEPYKKVNMRRTITEWRFKTVNRITYKRLFNYATQKWVGNWIKC